MTMVKSPSVTDLVLSPAKSLSLANIEYSRSSLEPSHLKEDTLNKKDGCSIPMMLLLSGTRMACSMSWAAQYAAFSPFLESMLPSYVVQLTQFIGPLLGLIISPMIGAMSDACTLNFGKRRPFLIFGAITSVICWTMLGYSRTLGRMLGDTPDERPAAAILSVLCYIWSGFTVNLFAVPAQLILADFAGNRQTTASAIGNAAFTLGSLSVALYIKSFGCPFEEARFQAFLAMLSVIMLTTVGLVVIFAKETPLKIDPTVPKSNVCAELPTHFKEIYRTICQMPTQLIILGVIFVCRCYGSTSYHGAKGQFFGIIVFDGDANFADACGDHCTPQQLEYNRGVKVAGGDTDIIYNLVGYTFSWVVPFMVQKFGAKAVVAVGMLPQVLFAYMAFSTVVSVNVMIVVASAVTQAFVDGTLVPIVINVLGNDQQIGIYVGAFNSFDCCGQLLSYLIAAILVELSPMGYALPILIGGIVSFIGFITATVFLNVKLNSL